MNFCIVLLVLYKMSMIYFESLNDIFSIVFLCYIVIMFQPTNAIFTHARPLLQPQRLNGYGEDKTNDVFN